MSNTVTPKAMKPFALLNIHRPNDYVIAVATVALMFTLRFALTPIVGSHYAFATFFFGIVFISMRYGTKPALLALLISFPLSVAVFSNNPTIVPHTEDEAIGDLFVLLNSGTIILLAQRQRGTYRQLAEKEEATRQHAQALERETQVRKQVEAERESSLLQLEDANLRLRRAMQETHHRVKNNLQVISALVDVQEDPDFPPPARSALKRISQHVSTLATVHDVLTLQAKSDSEVTDVPVRSIIPRLLNLMGNTLNDRPIQFRIDEIRLSARQIASLALLVNELVNNAIKHGTGMIEVTILQIDGTIHLEVCDDGPGFPADFDPARAAHTGLELVESMARWDLHGTVIYGNQAKGGARVQIAFPVS